MIAGLYRRYAPELVRYIRKYTEDQAAAEDIVQETFVRGMEHGSQLEVLEESQRRAWLYRTAKNICMDILRRNKFKTEDSELLKDELPSEDSFLEEIANQEMIRCVHTAINQLSGRSLEIATLALEGKSNPEIADALGISLNSVKSLKKEMYTKLRKIIGHEYIILFFVKHLLHADK